MSYRLGVMEMRFAKILWANQPIRSGEAAKLCEEEFEWKKSTTYTMLKRLCDRGIFENKRSVVSALLTEEEYKIRLSKEFLTDHFNGSISNMVSLFSQKGKLTKTETTKLKKLLNE